MSTGQRAETTHPDENRLAAFAERALLGAERQAVVAHLVDCARCREIVFLAREAGAAPELVPDKVGHPVSFWRRWQVTVPVAAAVALIGAALLIWQVQRLSVPSDYRQVAKTVTPQDKTRNYSTPAAKAPPAIRPGSIPHESGTATSAESQPRSQGKKAASNQAAAQELALHNLSAPALSGSGAGSSSANAAEGELPQTAVVPPQQPVPLVSQAPPATMQPESTPVAPSASKAVTETAEAEMEVLSSNAATARSLLQSPNSAPRFAIVKGKLRRWSASGFQVLRLPNGTKARSVASSANLVLVLSRSRRVYRSTDLGERWTEVPPQWQGKAAALEAESVVPSGSYPAIQALAGAAAGSSGGAAPQAAPSALTPNTGTNGSAASAAAKPPNLTGRVASAEITFVLTNSAGKRWVSHDGGQTWSPD
jgi:hypothetical protein